MSAILPSIQSPKPTILMQPIKYRYPVCAFSASLPVLRSPTSALRPVVVHIPAFPTVLSAVRRRLLMNAGSRDGDDVITPVSGPQPVPGPESRVDSETTPVVPTEDTSESTTPSGSWLQRFIAKRKNLRAGTLRNYGVAAVIAYGLFDFITYTVSFLLSVRAYIAAGKTLTWGTLPQVLALMWGINNLSRPFRIAGAIALAPVIDRRVVKPVGAFFSRLRDGKRNS